MSTLSGVNKRVSEPKVFARVAGGRIRESNGLLHTWPEFLGSSYLMVTTDLLLLNANMAHFQAFRKARKGK